MTAKDSLLAAFVLIAWGVTFLFMRMSLNEVSPMVLGMLRFLLLMFPAVFILPRPQVAWYWLVSYGLAISFGQFSLLFISLHLGMPTGLAALLHQSQVFFTVLLAALLLHEPIRRNHVAAMMLAAAGLMLIGIGQHQGAVPLLAMFASFGAAAAWGAGNIMVKFIGKVNALSLVVWGNISSLLAFSAVSWWLYGAEGVWRQISGMSWLGITGVAFLAYVAGLFGYAGWGALLSRYESGKVAPLSLLVPVIALLVAKLFLDEYMNGWHWAGVLVVMLSLLVQVFGGRLKWFNPEKIR